MVVFTLDGKMVHGYQLPDKQRMILRVPSGVYIVKASTQSCAQAKGLIKNEKRVYHEFMMHPLLFVY